MLIFCNSPETRLKLCELRRSFRPPAVGREDFFVGLRPTPLFFQRRRFKSSHFPEKNDHLLLLWEFLHYLFPATGRVSGSLETRWKLRELRRSFRPPDGGQGRFLAGASLLHPFFWVSQAKIRIFASPYEGEII